MARIVGENPQGITDDDFQSAWRDLTGTDTGFPSTEARVNRVMTNFYNICSVQKIDDQWVYFPKQGQIKEEVGEFNFDALEENVSSILESNGSSGIFIPKFIVIYLHFFSFSLSSVVKG